MAGILSLEATVIDGDHLAEDLLLRCHPALALSSL